MDDSFEIMVDKDEEARSKVGAPTPDTDTYAAQKTRSHQYYLTMRKIMIRARCTNSFDREENMTVRYHP